MRRIFDSLASLRLAIVLFLILAATSILGTFIPQGREPGFYLAQYGPFWGKLINFLSLYDAYHSWWYVALLSLFLLNLIFCSWKRFPVSLGLYRKDPFGVDPARLPQARSLLIRAPLEEIRQRLEGFRFRPLESGFLGVKDRYRWSYFAVYFVHGSILIIILGALIGALWGFRGSLSILEGETGRRVIPFSRKKAFITLPFALKLEKFEIEFYPNGMPKDYRSQVTVIDGPRSFPYLIRVNHPLTYKGVKVYQATYQEYAILTVEVKKGRHTKELIVKPFADGEWLEEGLTVGLIRYGEAHGFRMAQVWVKKEGAEPQMVWLIEGHQQTLSFSPEKFTLSLQGVRPVFMSGFQVRKDPGAPLVYLGCILMILGVFAAFFFTHRRLWVYLVPEKDGVRVTIGGYRKRYRADLKREIEDLLTKLERELS
ncbi:cytochrome c biogenesis protein ResB [Thermosulfurimonas marina]|uniref:Cytochrome c biogenesis protein ResB n=1 Tax=Thermosulfurimonas marina TaxID=2047767 RepID=A0A6H1WUW4_9BACT|nr:cytochrome c biogenesis protein ResB [Thermosulfurimonas marina]QJA06896.1 cytochrome c biogenesis protein ResB [Thermosulfurimonas marina]